MLGTTVSHYTILEKLGEGGMGVVYKAHDTALDRDVALKFLPHYLTTDPTEKERFYHEARAAASLTHQNIAVVYEIGEHQSPGGGQLFIAMEYVQGETLKKLIGSESLPIRKVLDIAIQICDGLAAAHEKGIVHRDIKSENIILTPKGQAKITDFGLAKVKGATKLTKTGSTLGTAAYMSPEQARGEEVDHRSDIFSFGVVLYELLTTRLPFRGEHPTALMYSIVNEEPQPAARFNEKVTPEIERVVAKALAKERDERYQHADEILADLRHERKMLEYSRSGYTVASQRVAPGPPAPVEPARPGDSARPVDPSPPGKTRPTAETAPGASGMRRPVKIAAAAGVLAVLAAAFLILRPLFFGEAISSERRTIAVISFLNQTGDTSFNYLQDAIPNLLITDLEQSKYLRVTTRERLNDLLKQAGKKGTTFIDRDIGFELCGMDGIEAIVLGSFTKAGDVFATDVKVIDVRTKDLLKSANSRGDGVGSILKTQIDELSTEISRGIGLSEKKIESTPMQIAERTTTSMEAYNYYMRGVEDYYKFYYEDARRALEKAVDIDSTFAVAYVHLAFACDGLNDQKGSIAAYRNAARYSYRAPEKERLMIASALAESVEKNPVRSREIMKEVVEKYPKYKIARYYLGLGYETEGKTDLAIAELMTVLQLDPEFGPAWNSLGYFYANMGEYEKALDCFRKYAAASPGDANPMDSMAEMYLKMGRIDDAIAKYREVLEIKPGFATTYRNLAYVLMLKEDFSGGMKLVDQFIAGASTPGQKGEAFWNRAIISYFGLGKLRQAYGDMDRARGLFAEAGNEDWISRTDLLRGWILYDRGQTAASATAMNKYLEGAARAGVLGHLNILRTFTFGLLALQRGDVSGARSNLAEMEEGISAIDSSSLTGIRYRRDLLRAGILMAEDSIDGAIDVIGKMSFPSTLPNLSSIVILYLNIPFSRDLAAQAYIRKGAIDRAITEYENIVAFRPEAHDWRLILPKYHYGLAGLLEKKGDTVGAVREYEKFLTFWKDADRDLPEVKDARARLSGLKSRGAS